MLENVVAYDAYGPMINVYLFISVFVNTCVGYIIVSQMNNNEVRTRFVRVFVVRMC